MEEFYLDSYIIDSIDNGLIHENIINSLRKPEIFNNNECFLKNNKYLLSYIKAYLVYGICGYVKNTESKLEPYDSISKSMSPTYVTNYIQLKRSEDAVYTEISILFDILKKASLSDDDLKLLWIMNKINYLNVLAYEKSPRFNELGKYDKLFIRALQELGQGIFQISKTELIKLSKCYILSKDDLSDEEYICGSSNFIYNIINDAYSLYEQNNMTLEQMLQDAQDDREKVDILRRIIKINNFKNR